MKEKITMSAAIQLDYAGTDHDTSPHTARALRSTSPLSDAPDAGVDERPFWLTGRCPAWCNQSHHDEDTVEDRKHMELDHVDDEQVVLSLEDAAVKWPGEREVIEPTTVRVWLEQDYREAEPHVVIDFLQRSPIIFEMTLAEAEEVARVLAERARIARTAQSQ